MILYLLENYLNQTMCCKIGSSLLNDRHEALNKESVTDSEFLLPFDMLGEKPTSG